MSNELLALSNALTIFGSLFWFVSGVLALRNQINKVKDQDITIQIKRKRYHDE